MTLVSARFMAILLQCVSAFLLYVVIIYQWWLCLCSPLYAWLSVSCSTRNLWVRLKWSVNMKDNLLDSLFRIYWTHYVEECGNIIVCPLNCFHYCIDVLFVDMYGISCEYWDDMYQCFLLLCLCFHQLVYFFLDVPYIYGHGCSGEPTEGIP